MTNKETLVLWFANEKANGLVDIKFFPGETAKASEESFCAAVLIALEQDKLGNSVEIDEL